MKAILATCPLLWMLSVAPPASATTLAQMRECLGCTATQAQTMAKNSEIGTVFIYDISAHVIRKFERYGDSTCRPGTDPGLGEDPGTNSKDADAQLRGSQTNTCGNFKAADPVSPVDASVQAVFDTFNHVWQINQTLAQFGQTYFRGDPPINPSSHSRFNMANVAWEYPAGTYIDFMDYMKFSVLPNKNTANAFVPGLGDLIYGVTIASATVSVGLEPNVQLAWDRNIGTISLNVCNPDGDCAKLTVQVNQGAVASVSFDGVFNNNNQMYPSQSGASPGQLTGWRFDLGTGAEHFRQNLRSNGIVIPSSPGCGIGQHLFLTTTRQGNQILFTSWTCAPNSNLIG